MGAPDEWPSRRLASRQNPAYRPADMNFLAAGCWEEVLAFCRLGQARGGHIESAAFAAKGCWKGANIPSPRACGERVRVRGGGIRQRFNEFPPLIPTFSP